VGASPSAAGPPQGAKAPSEGSTAHAVASVEASSIYVGRFAPSPTGPLHAGSLVAALASWLDARAHRGTWLVRIEDVDTPRCVPGADAEILSQLTACGLLPDAPPVYQSQRSALYQAALDQLIAQGTAYPCACSRKDIEAAWLARGIDKPRHSELVYPGTCRHGLQDKTARAWRFLTDFQVPNRPLAQQNNAQAAIKNIVTHNPQNSVIQWQDRWLGVQQQCVSSEVGDFVLRRADGLWAYQLAVVVDDAAQGVTHIVRGQDLADNTARQILLQRALGYTTPQYLHTPLVLAADGHKLSKQNGAQALNLDNPRSCIAQAAQMLGLQTPSRQTSLNELFTCYIAQWLNT
jgi:glutamyl-Q tRNA(Asp) synthetase